MIILVFIIAGLCLGSFVNALVWRLHEQQKSLPTKQQAQLSIWRGRSMCPRCRHELAARDLVPIVSWLTLHGKCRYCRQSISAQYPLVELITAGLFVFSYYFWPLQLRGSGLFQLVIWLGFLTGFMALAIYDFRWHVLPNRIIYPLIAIAVVQIVIVSAWQEDFSVLLGAFWGVVVLCGITYLLFYVSKGEWIGGGDVKLSALLGLIVGGPLASLLLLLIASCAGTVYALPLVVKGQAKRKTQVPFGPFLVFAAAIVRLFGASILNWYQQLHL